VGFEQAPGHVWEGRTVSGGGFLFASNVSTLIRVHDVFWPTAFTRFEPVLPQKRLSTKNAAQNRQYVTQGLRMCVLKMFCKVRYKLWRTCHAMVLHRRILIGIIFSEELASMLR